MPSQPAAPPLTDLRDRLREVPLRDERRLGRRLDRARRTKDPDRRAVALERVGDEIAAATAVVAARRVSVPAVAYPPELPVSAARAELLAALRDHQVVVVAGETGSGKTTQLPKLCLELGRGVRGMIGHTQPRRIAARTVSARIAEELGVELGGTVGYQIRFGDRTGPDTLVKVMTDGILLAEIQRDPQLRAYDTIILDEAHERSLNVDFLLGYLAQLLPRRPDLHLVVTSATIDPGRFAAHFGGAPIVEVSGRTYPVEVRYRPLDGTGTSTGTGTGDEAAGEGERDQITGICEAVTELVAEGPGDVLVFCSGEREIRDTADAVRGLRLREQVDVLPLYARLSAAEQQRVFAPHAGRRVVLATNVAETSLTVPGIRYVVDPGTARISRYSTRTKVQRLPIEKVSQASADQRKGRCGRVAAGVCIRLYSEDDFAARPAFTDPEILRTNLASVVLQMAALGIGDIEGFPFVDAPDRRSIRDALALLHELGAVTGEDALKPALTPVGRTLATLPVDPRLGRMLVEADRLACLREVLVIVAGLSIQDPRERPAEQRGTADALHARFADERSDFLAYLNLWAHVRERQRALGSSALRRELRAEHLHHLRIREWQDLHSQLRRVADDLGMHRNDTPADPTAVHQALLAGMLSHVGVRRGESREYNGARGTSFVLWPGSALAGSPPSWAMAAELVETSRLWGRTVARIEPEWVERLAGHLVQRTYSEPRWSRKRAAVVTSEKVTLYGLPIVAARTVALAPVDPETARALFIRHALVEGDWRSAHAFREENLRLLTELSDAEHKTRRREVVVDDEAIVAFYEARIPADVVSGRHFDAWWKAERRRNPGLLTLTPRDVLGDAAEVLDPAGRPDVWRVDGVDLPVTYRFDPGAADDGVTVHVPLAALHRLRPEPFGWQVPALRRELLTALVRGLPKVLRRAFVPVPDVVAGVHERLEAAGAPVTEPLLDGLARELHRTAGVLVPRETWDPEALPPHLRVAFRVFDGDRTLAAGRDLAALQRELTDAARVAVARATGVEVGGARTWTFGALPRTVRAERDGHVVEGYPAVVDEGPTAGVRILMDRGAQERHMAAGMRRLLLLDVPPPVRAVSDRLTNAQKLALTRTPHGSVSALLADATAAAVDALLERHGGPVWDAASYTRLRSAVAAEVVDAVRSVVAVVIDVLAAAQAAEARLAAAAGNPVVQPSLDDARAHLDALVRPGFIAATGAARLRDLVRYVTGIERRLERLGADPARDRERMGRIDAVVAEHAALLQRLGPRAAHPAVRAIRWMVEELRVSLHAQQLGTPVPISEQRVLRAIGEAEHAALAAPGPPSQAPPP